MSNQPSVWEPGTESVPAVRPQTFQVAQTLYANANQSNFSLTAFSYEPNTGTLRVYVNGVRVTDILETSGTTFSLPTGAKCRAGDKVFVEALLEEVGTLIPGFEHTKFLAAGGETSTAVVGNAANFFVFRNGACLDYEIDFTGNPDNTQINWAVPLKANDRIKIFFPTAVIAGESIGDMTKAVYDSDNDGKVNAAKVADEALSVDWSGVQNQPDLSNLHSHANKSTLDKISEAAGLPMWDGGAWPGGGGSGGVTDHGALTGLADDDHAQYFNQARGDARYALASALTAKQDALVSGINIKTINGASILGSGDLVVSGCGSSGVVPIVEFNGVETLVYSGSGVYDAVVCEIDTNKFIIAYIASADGTSVRARYAEVNGTSVSFGTELVLVTGFTGFNADSLSIAKASTSGAVLCYRDANALIRAYAISASGSTLSAGTSYAVDTSASSNSPANIVNLASGKVLIQFYSADIVCFIAATVTGTTMAIGAAYTRALEGGGSGALCKVADNVALFSGYSGSAPNCLVSVLSISGTTVSESGTTVYAPGITTQPKYISKQSDGSYLVMASSSSTITANTITISGAVPLWKQVSSCSILYVPTGGHWYVNTSTGRGVSLLNRLLVGGYSTWTMHNLDYQGGLSLVRDTGGIYTSSYSVLKYDGSSTNKLAVYSGPATGTLNCRVLQERLV